MDGIDNMVISRQAVGIFLLILNNKMEHDHRGIKKRYYPMRGLGSFCNPVSRIGTLANARRPVRGALCQHIMK